MPRFERTNKSNPRRTHYEVTLGRNSLPDNDVTLTDEDIQLILDRWLPKAITSGAVYKPNPHRLDRELAIQIVRTLRK